MNGEERRNQILDKLKQSPAPVSGGRLAKEFNVSRQVIVQDIALIRAKGIEIIPTHRGYILKDAGTDSVSRVFKVIHSEEQVRDELSLIVDLGGYVEDVFVYHKVYGVIRGHLGIRSRRDIEKYWQDIQSGKSRLLSNATSGYHYHTVYAESCEILDEIQTELDRHGYLAPLQDYEPVDFREQAGGAGSGGEDE